MAIFVYQPWDNGVIEYTGKLDYQRRYCPTAWNFWIDAANTAKHAVDLWSMAREAGRAKECFRAALKEARLFTESARAIAIVAHAEKGYEPARDRDPKKEFLEYSKKFHL